MKFITGTDVDTVGTSLRGHIVARKSDLIDAFGEPTWDEPSGDNKVTVEWAIQFDNGVIATIYDWKRYELGTPDLFEEIEWNIGGNDFDAASLVKEVLNRKNTQVLS